MKNLSIILSVAAAVAATSANAQSILGDSAAEDQITTLNEDIADDFERDTTTFGNDGRALGFTGAVAFQANATSGNTDTSSVGLGLNTGYFDGTNGYDFQLSYQRSENAGTVDEDTLLYSAQYTREFGAAYYGFAQLQGSVDTLPFDTSDNYLGAGVGYRIYNTADIQWAVQAGVGYRVADLNGISDFDEPAISLSSGYFNRLSDTVAFTMDTDIITSDSDTVVYNDLGVNVAMTDSLALRTSLVTEYHTDPGAGLTDTDNALGVSVIYNFN